MVYINNSNSSIQNCQTEHLKSILQNADKNKDGKVSIFELQNFRDTLKLLMGVSDNKDIQELFKAAQFAQNNFQSLNKATNGGSVKEGIDISGVDLVSQYDKNHDNVSLEDLNVKTNNDNDKNNIKTIPDDFMKFIHNFIHKIMQAILGQTRLIK